MCTRPCVQRLVDSISVLALCCLCSTYINQMGRQNLLPLPQLRPTSTGRPNCCVFRSNSTPAAITVRDYSGRNLSNAPWTPRETPVTPQTSFRFQNNEAQRKCIFERTDPGRRKSIDREHPTTQHKYTPRPRFQRTTVERKRILHRKLLQWNEVTHMRPSSQHWRLPLLFLQLLAVVVHSPGASVVQLGPALSVPIEGTAHGMTQTS